MKTTLIAVFMLLSRLCFAQDSVSFTISILDNAYLPAISQSGDHLSLTFEQSELTTIAGQYSVTTWQKAYATSRLEHLQQVYFITANSINLMYDLQNAFPDVFENGKIYGQPVWLFTPNDLGKAWANNMQEELTLINAQQAWDIDSGGANTIIGMTDEWVDTLHEDLAGKFRRKFINPTSNTASLERSHGTSVAGLIAAHTHNNKGMASIGWLCSLSDAPMSDSNILLMSQDNIRVVNASWGHSLETQTTLSFSGLADKVDLYNEIYENGTSVICAAGNQGLPNVDTSFGSASDYQFPASYDHNISVSSVGHMNSLIAPYDTANHEVNVKDYHASYFPGFGFGTMSHNSRVDICAPGFDLKSTSVFRLQPPNVLIPTLYDSTFTGTSGSAPMVSGTVGLMLHKMPCLTPYQVEYVLKSTALNLNTIPANSTYVGKLGAGRLNAGAALVYLNTHPKVCNDPTLQTMYIDGIEINSRCATTHPKLKVRVANGTAPYSYRWIAIAGNRVTLTDSSIGNPTVFASNGSNLLYYLVQVTDASTVPKVASMRVKVQLITTGWDLAMRDSYFDMLDEPNLQATVDKRNWHIWESPDLWNRKRMNWIDTPENVEYYSGGDSNYMFVRIRNVGCTASPTPSSSGPRVRLYWTLQSTGEQWPRDWKNRNVMVGTTSVPAGREITDTVLGIPIPSINPGDSLVLAHWWKPVDPHAYNSSKDSVEVCGLARIETSNTSPFGMKITENTSGTVSINVRNNNNIVTRNMMSKNLGHVHFTKKVSFHPLVGNADSSAKNFSLELLIEKDVHKHFAGNLSNYVYATVYLGDLYDRWKDSGSLGVYGITDDSAKTVCYDPATPLRLDKIHFEENESFQLDITFSLRDSVTIEYPISTVVHLRQLIGEGTDAEIYGTVSCRLNIEADESEGGGNIRRTSPVATVPNHQYVLYPNPVSGALSVRFNGAERTVTDVLVTDVAGKVLIRKNGIVLQPGVPYSLKMSLLPTGTYLVHITDNKGKTDVQKITKE